MKAVVATDFDGTLFRTDGTVSQRNIETLKMLKRRHVLRAIVTGRSFYSLMSAIDEDFPVDYYILSSGSGVYDVKRKKLIYQTSLSAKTARAVARFLLTLDCDFMIHEVLPHNHFFSYYRSGNQNTDFENRIDYYREHGREIEDPASLNKDISQFLVIEKRGDTLFETLCEHLDNCTIIQTTSPLDHESSWIEIFPKGTDKGSTLRWLAEKYSIRRERVFSIGNDFNDLHMLRWAGFSFVVSNASSPLLEEFSVVSSNDDDGFSEAVSLWMKECGL